MAARELDAVVVGAGFAGLYMLHRLRGQGLDVQVVEAGSGIGGTWFWNRYPGARCDIESMEYSYQFDAELQQDWQWSEKYATQPEILRYIEHVAERFDLHRDILLDTRVEQAHWDGARWQVACSTGAAFSARYLVLATGCLSSANLPDIPGRDAFAGRAFHTGQWPHGGVDFSGERVAVVGTGSSGIQSIPLIAEQADHLTVFQRTANYSVPAHNAPLDEAVVADIKARYADFRAANSQTAFNADFGYNEAAALDTPPDERTAEYERRWARGGLPFLAAFSDLVFDLEANRTAADFIAGKIQEQVDDPALAEKLTPTGVVGCKRLCVDTGYYATFNRANVDLVDVNADPIQRITPQGIETASGLHVVDSIVFATGFDAMTGSIMKIDIRGVDGATLQDAWAEGPKTYLGLGVAGFPNLFIVTGPGSPSVLTNMLPSIEHHVDWIADCIGWLDGEGVAQISPEPAAQEAWVAHVNEVAGMTVYPSCNSWYLGANVPGKPRVFMPYLGFPPYAEKCAEVVANGYEGFALTR